MEVETDRILQTDRAWWEHLFAVLDAGDAAGFVEFLTPDAHFRFGNGAPTIVGSEAIRKAAEGFFAAIASCRHRLLWSWGGPAAIACEGTVTYTRHDGSALTLPFANVLELRGAKVSAYRIYIDNSPLFGAAA